MKIAFFSTNRNFSQHVLEELNRNHTVKIWNKNPDTQIRWASTMSLLDWCDIAYLEWTQSPNVEISQIQGLSKPLIAFCHGYDAMYHTFMDWRNIDGLIIQAPQYPRLLRLRAEWTKNNPNLPPLPRLPKKVLVKGLGVDLQRFTPLEQPIPEYHIVTHSSKIRPVKRIYAALQQFYDLIQLDGDKPWKMTIVGEWQGGLDKQEHYEYLIACRELIEQLNFPADRLFIKGKNFPQNIWAQFAKTADLYWCTSWRESFGASMAEVCASGGYPLLNDYLGADKMYPEKYRCKTPYEMIQKTIEWGNMSQGDKIKERRIIRKYIEQFDAKQTAREIRFFIEEIVENYKR